MKNAVCVYFSLYLVFSINDHSLGFSLLKDDIQQVFPWLKHLGKAVFSMT